MTVGTLVRVMYRNTSQLRLPAMNAIKVAGTKHVSQVCWAQLSDAAPSNTAHICRTALHVGSVAGAAACVPSLIYTDRKRRKDLQDGGLSPSSRLSAASLAACSDSARAKLLADNLPTN